MVLWATPLETGEIGDMWGNGPAHIVLCGTPGKWEDRENMEKLRKYAGTLLAVWHPWERGKSEKYGEIGGKWAGSHRAVWHPCEMGKY